MRLRVPVLAVLASLVSPAVRAERHRFHPLTPTLERRLAAASQRNARAVIRYGVGQATGFLVHGQPGRDATGWVLTNEHVYTANPWQPLVFADGTETRVLRHIAVEKQLDYALVEVDLPAWI